MKKKALFFAILIFLICAGLSAQAGNGFSPVVSQIRAESRNNFIRLTWIDSPDARGNVYIFRSTRPFGSAIPANIRPVIVRYGEQYFIDDAEDIENIYYFIAASDSAGRRFDVIIPQTNTIGINVSKGEITSPPAAVVQEKEVIQGISNLRARQDGESVIITFNITGPRKNTVLYRSTQPIKQPRDLLNASIVKSGVSSPFTDFPLSGISWYYALAFEDEVTAGSIEIKPGVNTTAAAVTIASGAAEKAIRPIPLPIMTLNMSSTAALSGSSLSDYLNSDTLRAPLSEAVEKMLLDSGLPEKAAQEQRNPRVFMVDLQMPAAGADSALFQIISEYFVTKNWEGARAALLHYLSLPRSKDVESRVRFYLGQALYFTGNYRGALFEFLTISSEYPDEANSWIETVLSAMVH